jgi:hypothetical protein
MKDDFLIIIVAILIGAACALLAPLIVSVMP